MRAGHDKWPPAPPPLIFDNYDDFDGVKITSHEISHGSDYFAEVNPPQRIQKKDGTIIYDSKIIFELPYNSGLLGVWFALDQGFDPIYTVGIDMMELNTGGNYWDESKVKDYLAGRLTEGCEAYPYIRLHECGFPWRSKIHKDHIKDSRDKYWADRRKQDFLNDMQDLLDQFPNQTVYKSHDFSLLPVEVKTWV